MPLATTKYTRPGAYLSPSYSPKPTSADTATFRLCVVGRGHRLARTNNASVARSWVSAQALTFTSVAPFMAVLTYKAKNDRQPPVSLYDDDGNEVPISKWSFYDLDSDGYYERVLFNPADYNPQATYSIDYWSSENTVQDALPFTGPRRILQVGDFPNEDKYTESLEPATDGGDFVIPGILTSFSIGSTNTNKVPAVSAITKAAGAGLGVLSFGASNAPTSQYTRYWKLSCTAIGASQATFKLQIWNMSGGNSAGFQAPLTSSCANITFTVEDAGTGATENVNRQVIEGIYLDFDFSAGNFSATDVFTWWSYGPGLVEAHSAYDSNNSQFASISTPVASGGIDWTQAPPTTGSNTSTATAAVAALAEYTGAYTRHYKMQVTAIGGAVATGSLVVSAHASIANGNYFYLGNGVDTALKFVWWKSGTTPAASGVIAIDVRTASSNGEYMVAAKTQIELAGNWPSGAAGLSYNSGSGALANLHKGTAGNVTTSQVGNGFTITGMSGGTVRTATIEWAGTDELPYTTGSMSLNEGSSPTYTEVTLENGIKLTWTWPAFTSDTYFVVSDTWTFTARPGRKYYNAKDDRIYTLTIGTAVDQALSTCSFAATTIEGGYGVWSSAIATNGSGGLVELGDNIKFFTRNAGTGTITGPSVAASTRFAASDTFTFAATCQDVLVWSIGVKTSETFTSSLVYYDAIGSITGTPNTYYVILTKVPKTLTKVLDAGGLVVSYTGVSDTQFVWFTSNPITGSNTSITVYYEHEGDQPTVGNVYYVTGTRLRATAEYDTPMLWRQWDACMSALSPSSISNDVKIGVEVLYDSTGGALDGWYTAQVRDSDDDGVYLDTDYKRTIQATSLIAAISHLVVLNKFSSLGTAMTEVRACNDPFHFPSKIRQLWIGMPASSAVGDENTASSIVYTSKRTLPVSGNSPSHGCHTLLGNTWATRAITLDDGTTKTVTLDGSFIALASVAMQLSFSDIADSLLMKKLSGVFLTMEEFSDADELALGAASVLYLHKVGDGIFQFYESVTTDTSSIEWQEINAVQQQHHMIRGMTTYIFNKLVGWVPPDPLAGLDALTRCVVEYLSMKDSQGAIAPFGSEQDPPTRRPVNPSTDVATWQDRVIKTNFYWIFWFNLRYVFKRASGMFGVDSNAIMKGLGRTN